MLMSAVKIRAMKKSDIKKLSSIYSDAYAAFDVGEKWDSKSAYKLLFYWFKRQPDLGFVAEVDGKLAGAFIAGIKPWWDGNHLVDGEIFVDPGFQKMGIGSLLMKELCAKARKKYRAVVFDTLTFRSQDFPLRWYKKLGFGEINEWVLISASVTGILEKLK